MHKLLNMNVEEIYRLLDKLYQQKQAEGRAVQDAKTQQNTDFNET
jgi:hypothetical protein